MIWAVAYIRAQFEIIINFRTILLFTVNSAKMQTYIYIHEHVYISHLLRQLSLNTHHSQQLLRNPLIFSVEN